MKPLKDGVHRPLRTSLGWHPLGQTKLPGFELSGSTIRPDLPTIGDDFLEL